MPGYENTTWVALAAPARTPQAIIQRLNREINTILELPDVKEAARAEGSTITGGTPERFRALLNSELAKYGRLVREAGIKYE